MEVAWQVLLQVLAKLRFLKAGDIGRQLLSYFALNACAEVSAQQTKKLGGRDHHQRPETLFMIRMLKVGHQLA